LGRDWVDPLRLGEGVGGRVGEEGRGGGGREGGCEGINFREGIGGKGGGFEDENGSCGDRGRDVVGNAAGFRDGKNRESGDE
jgi:hypothetical protein